VGARKVGELAADGANGRRVYWQALKNRKGFPRWEIYQAKEKLCCTRDGGLFKVRGFHNFEPVPRLKLHITGSSQFQLRLSLPETLKKTAFSPLTRIIHEHFCCNRRFAAATSLRRAGSQFAPSTYCTSTPQGLTAPRARLATRLSDFATNRHE